MISAQDDMFMGRALQLAQHSLKKGSLPIGAVVARGNKIVGTGQRSEGVNTRFDHAEIIAMRKAIVSDRKLASDLTLYVTLEPCLMCFGAILHSGIGRVVFGLEDPSGGATSLRLSSLPERYRRRFPKITAGVRRPDSKRIFKQFFATTASSYWKDPQNPLFRLCSE